MLKYSIGSKVLDLLLVEICECLLLFFCCWMCMPIYQFHFQLVSIFHTDCVFQRLKSMEVFFAPNVNLPWD